MATYERLDYGSDDGSQWGGASTDRIGFFGTTPGLFSSIINVSTATHHSTVISSLVVSLKRHGLV